MLATTKHKGSKENQSFELYSRSAEFKGVFASQQNNFNTSPFDFNQIPLQAKLKINTPGDRYEQEADRIADRVVNMNDVGGIEESGDSNPVPIAIGSYRDQRKSLSDKITSISGLKAQRKCSQCEEEEEEVQRKSTNSQPTKSTASFNAQLNATKGGGNSMDVFTNQFMSSRFGVDFSHVNIHSDNKAATMSQSINAKAFTLGDDIYFNRGAYQPQSNEGKRLLAHELVHTQQQSKTQENIQRALGDGHDLTSPRFMRNPVLEEIFDGNQQLSRGDSGNAVSKIQHALQDLGIFLRYFGVDGEFEGETETKVRVYQSRKGITTDPSGVVGEDTMTALDNEFSSVTDNPSTLSQNPADIACIEEILCPWNRAIIDDFRSGSRRVIFVDRLFWADERFDGTNWVPHPMEGAGETTGNTIRLDISDDCEAVAQTLYHEYQHTRSPRRLASEPWADEEGNAYSLETSWSIARGITADPSLTTTDPNTGETIVDTAGVESQVATYPGMVAGVNEEIVAKVGANRVRVRRENGSVYVRAAAVNDTVEGPRNVVNAQSILAASWPACP